MLATASCVTITDVLDARVLSTELTTPAPLVRVLEVELDRPADVTVEYWTDDDVRLRVTAPLAQASSAVLTRLRPGRIYRYRVLGTDVSGLFVTRTQTMFRAEPLATVGGESLFP